MALFNESVMEAENTLSKELKGRFTLCALNKEMFILAIVSLVHLGIVTADAFP